MSEIKNDEEYKLKLKLFEKLFEVDRDTEEYKLLKKTIKEVLDYEKNVLGFKIEIF